MPYFDGFLVAVPTANMDAYREHAATALPLFKEFGATRMVEGWGDDVPRGKTNDMWGAVAAKEDETVLFSWVEYPDKATREAAYAKMESDERMKEMGEMPFDGMRMIWGGFEAIHVSGNTAKPGYVDGVVVPVPADARGSYGSFCEASASAFLDHGALRVVDGWAEDVRDGKVTDFHRAIHRQDGETVGYGWVEWPDKKTRDAGWEKLMSDPRMTGNGERPFDGKRMIFGGFVPILDA